LLYSISIWATARSNVEVGSATVNFDESKTGSDAISGAIQSAGYKIIG